MWHFKFQCSGVHDNNQSLTRCSRNIRVCLLPSGPTIYPPALPLDMQKVTCAKCHQYYIVSMVDHMPRQLANDSWSCRVCVKYKLEEFMPFIPIYDCPDALWYCPNEVGRSLDRWIHDFFEIDMDDLHCQSDDHVHLNICVILIYYNFEFI